MILNVVVETLPGKAQCVADVIGEIKGMALRLVEGDHRVLATWDVPDGHNPEPEGLSEALRAMTPEVVDVGLGD
jgi:hypothetical protein